MTLPNRFLGYFVETIASELGADTLQLVLAKSGLDVELANPEVVFRYTGDVTTGAYAGIQGALRLYYGRGARGTLNRIGRLLWLRLLENSSILLRTRAGVVRSLPLSVRTKPALELLAELLGGKSNSITIHSLDLDWMLVDAHSPGAAHRQEKSPICFVTMGLIQECLYWASEYEYDVQETSCLSTGGDACEFHVKAR